MEPAVSSSIPGDRSLASQATFATNPHGHVVQMLPVAYGKSTEFEVTQNTGNPVKVHSNTGFQFVRIWAIGAAVLYVFGGEDVAPPNEADAHLGAGMQDQFPLLPHQTHVRVKTRDGDGSFRVELLGYP
jgi:hypothetical protein